MAETLRELVVSLSLQSDNFSRNIKSLDAQVKEAESRFKAAGAGVDDFSHKTDGLGARASTLTQKLQLQSQIVQQYERSLKAAETSLQTAAQKQQNLTTRLNAAKTSQAALGKEVDRAKASLQSLAKEYGVDSAEVANASDRLDELTVQYEAATAEVKKLDGQLTAQNKTMQAAADRVAAANTSLNNARASMGATESEIKKVNAAIETNRVRWEAAAKSLDKFGQRATTAGQNMARIGQSLTMYVTTPLLALGGYAFKASIDAESAFAGVRKTVDMTDEEFAKLDQDIRGMTFVKASDYAGIAKLAEVGGQLGVTNDNLEKFTATMTDLGVATNLAGEEGASELAKYANITNMAQSNFDRFGATIVDLGNNMATTEAATMEMAMRIAAAGSQVGLSDAQILGFSSALSSVGLEAEAGGTAFSRAMIGMQIAVETGKNGLKDYAKVAGMSSKEFQQAWKTDAAGAIQAFIVGLSKMDESGVSTIKTLNDMGFTQIRLRDTLMRASNANQLFASAQTIATSAWQKNTALTDEANKRYGTTASQLTMLKNRATDLARTYGDDLTPTMNDLIEKANGLLEGLSKMDASQRQTMMTTAAWIAAIGPGIMLVGKLNTGIGALATGFGNLIEVSVKAGGGLKGVLAATGSLLGPAGIAVLTGAVIYGATQWHDYASGAKAAREALQGIEATAKKWKETQATTIFDTGNDPLARFGLSKDNFSGGQTELEDWLSRLTDTWSDGKKETNEIVKSYVDEFTAGSDKIREAIKARKKTQEKYGVVDDKTTADDLKKLDKYDKQVAALLKKKRNGKLSEKDQQTLNQLIQERVQIQLKYTTGEGGGYDSLEKAVEAEKARLASEGKTPDADLYGDTLTGAAQGYQSTVDSINQSYRDQYADIMAITDEKERQDALTQLNLEHTEALKKAQEEYNAVLGKYAPETFQTPEVQQAQDDLQKLTDLITTINADGKATPEELESLKTLTDGMDEGKLASLKALIDQLNQNGLGNLNLGKEGEPVITASSLLGGYDTVTSFLEAHKGEWTGGLSELFGATSDEANRIDVMLSLTPEGQAVKDWLDADHTLNITGVTIKTGLTVEDIPATGKMFAVTLKEGYTPEDIAMSGKVTSAYVVSGTTASGTADVNGQMAYVSLAPGADIADVYATGLISSATPVEGLKATVDTDARIISYTPDLVKASGIPTVPVKAGIDLSAIDQATIDAYYAQNPDKKPSIFAEVGLTQGWGTLLKQAYDAGTLTVFGPTGAKLDVVPELDTFSPADLIKKGENGEIPTDKNGNPIITVIIHPQFEGTTSTVKGATDTVGTPETQFGGILPKPSTKSALDEVIQYGKVLEGYKNGGFDLWGLLSGNIPYNMNSSLESSPDTIRDVAMAVGEFVAAVQKGEQIDPESIAVMTDTIIPALSALEKAGAGDTMLSTVNAGLKDLGVQLESGNIASGLASIVASAKQMGTDTGAGIGTGMSGYNFAADASKTAANAESALKGSGAFDINSPSKKMVPIGVSIAEGVAKGVDDGSYKVKAAMVRMALAALRAAKDSLVVKSPSHVMRDQVGVMIPRGVVQGIEQETTRQQQAVQNAFRSLVQPALAGAQAGMTDNRRSYSIRQGDIIIPNAQFSIRDKQDIRALALELHGLQVSQQRALGGVYSG